MIQARSSDPNIVLFCGGRGSATITRELLGRPRVGFSLLVNAYDDGLSTGTLRDFISGMLGPSDFRKNLSYLLDLYSAQQYALQQLLEYRIPEGTDQSFGTKLEHFARTGQTGGLPEPLAKLLFDLDKPNCARISGFLREFFDYAQGKQAEFDYSDCSFGNLIFAGAYLKSGNFNVATRELARIFASQAELINVSQGECRTLVALKEDGQILACEAEIANQQSSPAPIRNIYFFERRPDRAELDTIAGLSLVEKENWLLARRTDVVISEEARQALENADIIIYGPGTQHSSLLPSYRIAAEAIRQSPASVKALVINLREDHDIKGQSAVNLVDRALHFLADCDNSRQVVTHILYNQHSDSLPDGVKAAAIGTLSYYKGAQVIRGDFQNLVKPTVHNGFVVISEILEVFEDSGQYRKPQKLDIYVDLLGRATGLDPILQELIELNWADYFDHVRLRVNRFPAPALAYPAYLQVETSDYPGEHTESAMLRRWIENDDTDYLATLTGDGEYRLRDVLQATSIIKGGNFGAVFGSRLQSLRQHHSLLKSAYGEGVVLYGLGRMFALILTGLFILRFGLIFSDPLTGFRVYKRARMPSRFVAAAKRSSPMTSAAATTILLKNKVEIAEIPVTFRTFSGFTRPGWRISRAFRNVAGFFFGGIH